MKRNMRLLILMFFVAGGSLYGDNTVVETLKKATGVINLTGGEQLFVDVLQEKKNQLQKLQEFYHERLAIKEKNNIQLRLQIEEVQNTIERVEDSLKPHTHTKYTYQYSKYLNKQLDLHKEIHQVLKDTQRGEDDFDALVHSLLTTLEQFVQDPEGKKFKSDNHLEPLHYHSFDDLRNADSQIVNQERLVAQLAEQEKNTHVDLENRKRAYKGIEEEHAKRREELQNFAEQHTAPGGRYEMLTIEQQEKELIATEERLFRHKKHLYELRIQESKYALELIQLRLLIERVHLDVLKQYLKAIKSSIRVTEPDLLHAREYLDTQKKGYFTRRARYQKERDRLASEQKIKERYRDIYALENNIPLGRDLDDWSREPKQTVLSYVSCAALGALNAEVQWLAKERDLLETQRALEDEKFNYITTLTNAKETYHKISGYKFPSAGAIPQAINQYETQKIDASSTLAIYKERINTVADLLNQQKKVLDNISVWRERVLKQKEQLFKGHASEYTRMLELLNAAEEFVKKRIDVLGKLTGVYSGIISEVNGTLRLLQFILGELQSVTIWYRPEYAVTLQGIKNVPSDIQSFLNDIRGYVTRSGITMWKESILSFVHNPLYLLLLLFKIMVLMFLLFNVKHALPRINRFFSGLMQTSVHGFIRSVSCWIKILTAFLDEYFFTLSIWILMAFIFMVWLADPYIYALFCLCSIPFLLYMVHRFMGVCIRYNGEYDYMIVSSEFQSRFMVVLSVLLYATSAIFFFRQAFVRVSYYTTEFPTILLAVNFIIFQIALISLITKDQILSIIPQKNDVWIWVREQVEHYFYFILLFFITIIVMSNPYVGFGRLVLYILSGLIYSLIIFKLLIAVYRSSKNTASQIFFIEDEELMRERFDHARTWFGLFIIVSFFAITFLGVFLLARIWGWQIDLKDISSLLHKPLMLENTAYPLTMVSVLQIVMFVLAGLSAAYAVNRFVLDKIFDLLVVDPGVQYTTTRFLQYFIMVIFIFFGFKNVGLGDLIGYLIGALAIGIGWYVREPIGDFIAYFIILVQRPLKIGDFIRLDNEIFGFVRKITPRAVILRKKNSTTIVIPNSQIMNRTMTNWNYVRNFIAFDDIFIAIAYKEDPQRVKELLMIAVSAHPNVLRNPKPMIRLEDFSEYGYLFLVRGFISSAFTQDMWDIASDVRLNIIKTLREHNIEIAEYMKFFREGMAQSRLTPKDRNGA